MKTLTSGGLPEIFHEPGTAIVWVVHSLNGQLANETLAPASALARAGQAHRPAAERRAYAVAASAAARVWAGRPSRPRRRGGAWRGWGWLVTGLGVGAALVAVGLRLDHLAALCADLFAAVVVLGGLEAAIGEWFAPVGDAGASEGGAGDERRFLEATDA